MVSDACTPASSECGRLSGEIKLRPCCRDQATNQWSGYGHTVCVLWTCKLGIDCFCLILFKIQRLDPNTAIWWPKKKKKTAHYCHSSSSCFQHVLISCSVQIMTLLKPGGWNKIGDMINSTESHLSCVLVVWLRHQKPCVLGISWFRKNHTNYSDFIFPSLKWRRIH